MRETTMRTAMRAMTRTTVRIAIGTTILASLLGLLPGSARAEGPEPLSLEAAIALARENSPAIRESEAMSEAARAARKEAQLTRLPGIEIAETALRTNSPADVFGLQLMQERFSFPAFTSTDPNDPEALDNVATEVRTSLPLFTGGRIRSAVRQASSMADAAADMRDHTIRAVELGVSEAYLGSLLADRFVELAERARETTRRHLQQAQDFFDSEMIVESDLLQARVQMARMEENLIRSRNQASLARAGLNRAMGVSQDREFVLTETSSLPDSVAPALESVLHEAGAARSDLAAMNQKARAAAAGIGLAQAGYWPQVGLGARYLVNDNRFLAGHGQSYAVMLQAEWKIWDWGLTRARVSRGRSEHRAAEEAARSYREQVEFEVRQASQNLGEARARHAVTLSAVEAAERSLSILEDRFNQGIARTTDLLDAETAAHESRIREAQARFDLATAVRSLYFATGQSPIPEVSQ